MTQAQVVDLLRELRGLERVEAAIRQAGAAAEWRYALTAIDDRLRWLRYCLSLEHPVLVGAAHDLLTFEALDDRPRPDENRRGAADLPLSTGTIH